MEQVTLGIDFQPGVTWTISGGGATATFTPDGRPGADTSPIIPGGAPLASLTYEGAVYYLTPLSTDEAANLNEDDLELVGSTVESVNRPG